MGVVSRRWVWLVGVGVVVRRYIDFLILLIYPYSSCIVLFCSSIPTFCSFFKMFFVLVLIQFSGVCTVGGLSRQIMSAMGEKESESEFLGTLLPSSGGCHSWVR